MRRCAPSSNGSPSASGTGSLARRSFHQPRSGPDPASSHGSPVARNRRVLAFLSEPDRPARIVPSVESIFGRAHHLIPTQKFTTIVRTRQRQQVGVAARVRTRQPGAAWRGRRERAGSPGRAAAQPMVSEARQRGHRERTGYSADRHAARPQPVGGASPAPAKPPCAPRSIRAVVDTAGSPCRQETSTRLLHHRHRSEPNRCIQAAPLRYGCRGQELRDTPARLDRSLYFGQRISRGRPVFPSTGDHPHREPCRHPF